MSDRSVAVFSALHDREVRVSADRRTITHHTGARLSEYDHSQFLYWLAWFRRKAVMEPRPEYWADLEVLTKARDLLVSEGVLTTSFLG